MIKTQFNWIYDSLSEDQKGNAKYARNLAISTAIYSVGRAAILHAIGHRIAPNVFKSFGRTYAISFALRLAVARPRVSEDDKAKILALQNALKSLQEDQRNYGDHNDLVKG